jgi:hypothetical protein
VPEKKVAMRCSICGSPSEHVFTAKILSKHDAEYFSCHNCGFLQTQEPFWLPEAYRHTLNSEDTMVMQRNQYYADVAASLIFSRFNYKGKFLDFGGGHGVFVRLMRDKGFDFYWSDPHADNIFAQGFEFGEQQRPIELLTCIECFEHFTDPIKELETMLAESSNIFFTTQILPSPVPRPDAWDYYAPTHGQHISFYSIKTLEYIAARYGLHLYTNSAYMHLFTKKKIGKIGFWRATHPGPFRRIRLKNSLDSKYQKDFEDIVQKKKLTPLKSRELK